MGGTLKFIDRRRFLTALAAGVAFADVRAYAAEKPLIMLDAGHGGVDPGAIGVVGTYEKDIALPTVKELARQLEATKRFRVKLTRAVDEFIPLAGRVQRARAVEADLFLSIHADALPNRAERGASVYTLSETASDKEAALLAASENRADQVGGVKLDPRDPVVSGILIDLARRQTNNLSIQLAQEVVAQLKQRIVMLNNSHRSAGFAVLKAPDIPSALVEIGCLSNRSEERDLRGPAYRTKVAQGLVRSINGYFDSIA